MRRVDVKEQARHRELRVSAYWQENQIFQKSIDHRASCPNFVFYDGPPTANGLPHIGHTLGRVLKDFICRYKTMRGYQVVRKAGWDTHGLPVELGVEKELGISGKQEIESYGIRRFIEKCKESVFTYEKEWRRLTEAIGYWVDMDDPYITMDNRYIESVWYILSTIHEKGLLYQGYRVSPYCPCCQTTLSSHEVSQGYEEVKDLSAIAKFRGENGDFFLAWTTTPWTLPGNVALVVNEELEYVRVRQQDEVYVLAKSRVDQVMTGEYEVLSTHRGREFVGARYTPVFPFVSTMLSSSSSSFEHRVIAADFVSDHSGTGIVHISPAYGEDDYRVAKANNLPVVHVVDKAGRFIEAVTPWAGRFVKDCDVDIVKHLAQHGLLHHKEKYEHRYPFCWRCKTPLLYYAMESWFIQTTAVKEQMIENNQQIDWHPDHLRNGRFGRFLEELVDWNISRNRFWGTPLNVWVCTGCKAEYSPHSIADLLKRAIGEVDADIELHRPYIDEVKIRCESCQGVMERTPEVIDVWFDSGSMPFAQYHVPFENREVFEKQFPADMICEGIDQTRGWFYSLLAVSTLFTGRLPYKGVISTGLILDENGQKMSKSKGNVVDPWTIIEQYGADAFRWALLSDSLPWNSKRFSSRIVAEAKSKLIDTLTNAHAFFTLYASIDQYDVTQQEILEPSNDLDRWVLSRVYTTLKEVREQMDAGDIVGPARNIQSLVDEMSNWYIRRSRSRFWKGGMSEDKRSAYQTLHRVLVTISQMVAPFIPFIAEEIYRNLGGEGSVHLTDYPVADETWIDETLEQDMHQVRQIVELARHVRNETGIKTRQPLLELIVIMDSWENMAAYEDVIKEEINVKQVKQAEQDFDFMDFSLKLDFKVAGPKLGRHVKEIQQRLSLVTPEEARQIVSDGKWVVKLESGEEIVVGLDSLLIEKKAKEGMAMATDSSISVVLNTTITPELREEGWIRQLIRGIQDIRKEKDLPVENYVDLIFDTDPAFKEVIERFEDLLRTNVLLRHISYEQSDEMEEVSIEERKVKIGIIELS